MITQQYVNKFKVGNSFNSLRRDRQPGWINNKNLNIARMFLFPKNKDNYKGRTGMKWSEEHKENLRQKAISQLEKQRIFCDTKPERLFENQLLFNNIIYIKQYPTGKGLCDFYLPETNTIIEIDGIYWHSFPKRKERDERNNIFWRQNDYTVYRFTDKEIYDDVERCLKSIQLQL